MASANDIATVRRMTDTTNADPVYTDEVVGLYIDNLGSNEAAAGAIWGEIAAKNAKLVDMSESGSSRSLSQLTSNALKLQQHFTPDEPANEAGSTFTIPIVRL